MNAAGLRGEPLPNRAENVSVFLGETCSTVHISAPVWSSATAVKRKHAPHAQLDASVACKTVRRRQAINARPPALRTPNEVKQKAGNCGLTDLQFAKNVRSGRSEGLTVGHLGLVPTLNDPSMVLGLCRA